MNGNVAEMEEADWQVWACLQPNGDVPFYGVKDLDQRPLDDEWDVNPSCAVWNMSLE